MGSTVFPLSFSSHVIFCVIAVLFFLIQYIRLRYTYQLLTIFAVAGTMLLYLNDSQTFFYGVGLYELVMMILIAIFISKQKKANEKSQKKDGGDNSEESSNT